MRDYEGLVERLHKRIASTAAGSPLQDDLLEAADAIEELVSNADKFKWISVEERLPEKSGAYLVCYTSLFVAHDKPSITIMCFSKNLEEVDDYDFVGRNRSGWYDYDSESGYYEREGVTHWTPLPGPPAKEEKTENE